MTGERISEKENEIKNFICQFFLLPKTPLGLLFFFDPLYYLLLRSFLYPSLINKLMSQHLFFIYLHSYWLFKSM